MKLDMKQKDIIYNIINQYLKSENTTIDVMSKKGILSKKTLDKILKGDYISLQEKTLRNILTFPNLNKRDKDRIKNILTSKIEDRNLKKNNNVIKELINEILCLKKENEKLKEDFEKTFKILNQNTSFSYNEKLKNNAFKTDFDTTTKIIPLLWKLRDETSRLFSELELLLEINNSTENIKMSKGLNKVGNDLIKMGEKIIKYSKKAIIDLEE